MQNVQLDTDRSRQAKEGKWGSERMRVTLVRKKTAELYCCFTMIDQMPIDFIRSRRTGHAVSDD